jgi:opacity protein-like surface antigen
MLKFSVLCCSILLWCGFSFAQPFGGGFFAGMTASQVDGDTYAGYNKIGLTAGAYVTRELTRRTDLKAELRYIQKGAYHKGSEQDPSLYKLTVHYVELPVMYQFYLNDNIIFDAGLAPSVFLFYREEDENGEFPEDNPFRRLGLDASIGANYKFTDHLIAGLRYSYSVIPIRDHPSGQTYRLNHGQYSNLFSFSLYYDFK